MAHNSSSHPAQKRYPPELRERAVRMVLETMEQTGQRVGVITRIARQLGIGAESLRGWVRQAEVDGGRRPGVPTAEQQRIAELEREVRELRRANEILKAASAFFARELCATRRRDNRGGVRDRSRWAVAAAWGSLGAAGPGATPGRAASGPDKGGTYRDCQTARVRVARSEGVTQVNPCLTLRNSEAGSNLADRGRCAAHGHRVWGGRLRSRVAPTVGRPR